MKNLYSLLQKILNKRLKIRVFNQFLFYILINIILYLLLISVLIIFNPPILPLYLMLFISLSLLPLFLLPLGQKDARLPIQTIRRIDEQCLIESYLHTDLPVQRAFMENRLDILIEKKLKQKPGLLNMIEKKNILLFCIVPVLFILFEIFSIIAFNHVTLKFSIHDLKTRVVQKHLEALPDEADEPSEPGITQKQQWNQETPVPERGMRETDMKVSESTGSIRDQDITDAVSDMKQAGDIEQTEKVYYENQNTVRPGENRSYTRANEPSDKLSDLLPGKQITPAGQSGYQDAGKSFLESPVQSYDPVQHTIHSEGDASVKAGAVLQEDKMQEQLNRLFRDFSGGFAFSRGFNPLADQIKEKYLRLVHEKY